MFDGISSFLRLVLNVFLQPVRAQNWELHVQFRVSGTTKDLFGDGFAIWYTRDRMKGGDVFGNMDYFSGMAIIADTYSNHNGPHNVSSIRTTPHSHAYGLQRNGYI